RSGRLPPPGLLRMVGYDERAARATNRDSTSGYRARPRRRGSWRHAEGRTLSGRVSFEARDGLTATDRSRTRSGYDAGRRNGSMPGGDSDGTMRRRPAPTSRHPEGDAEQSETE